MPTSIRLDPKTEKRLDFLSSKTGRSKAFYIRKIIEQGIEDIEDYYLAVDISEQIKQGKEELYTTEEVRKELGLDD